MESIHHSSPESEQPGSGQQSVRKRKRKTFSCDTCRKRKLKCTRELPVCSRCQKSGNAANCMYETPPEPGSATGFTPSRPHMTEIDYRPSGSKVSNFLGSAENRTYYPSSSQAVDRIAALESRIAAIDPNITAHSAKRVRLDVDANIEPAFVTKENESIGTSFYGAGFKTGYFGPSSERNVVSYYPVILKMYPDFKVLVSFHHLQNPLFGQVRNHLQSLRKNSNVAKKILPYPSVITLFDAVPDKDTCTKLISLYWETVASTYHIFHGPTFWSTFWLYWSDSQQRTEAFACTILLMLAAVNSLECRKSVKYRGLSSVTREQASYWIEICESWMNRQSRKHLTIDSFQNRVLLVISKQINAIKRKQIWERASELLTFAISTGLHQDPTKIDGTFLRDQTQGLPLKPKSTPYEREMRRRLWAAIVELEMQASMDKGVPSSRLALLADCGPPTLLADEQFEVSSSALPTNELRSKYTAVSYLHLSHESLRLRAMLSNLINSGTEHLAYDEVLSSDDEIKRAINDLPEWVKNKNQDSSLSTNELSATPAALLELQLLQFQILLHTPSARLPENDSRSNLSRMTCIDSAVRILGLHVRLAQSKPSNLQIHWLNLMREDVFRATVAICYNLVLWRGLNSELSSVWMRDIYTESSLQGVDLFKHKVLILGEHYVQLWYTYTAIGMVRGSFEMSNINAHISSVAEDLTAVFGTIMSAQEEPSNEQTAAGALTALATPNSGGYDAGSGTTPLPMPDLASSQVFIDGVDVNSWGGFDDLWPFSSTGLSW